jgi:hypothetical protein
MLLLVLAGCANLSSCRIPIVVIVLSGKAPSAYRWSLRKIAVRARSVCQE